MQICVENIFVILNLASNCRARMERACLCVYSFSYHTEQESSWSENESRREGGESSAFRKLYVEENAKWKWGIPNEDANWEKKISRPHTHGIHTLHYMLTHAHMI